MVYKASVDVEMHTHRFLPTPIVPTIPMHVYLNWACCWHVGM
jgi:hypothetical protein